MKKLRALIIDDDPMAMEIAEDLVFSLGHDHVSVTNLKDAREALVRHSEFDYVLLDMCIPPRANRGGASKEYGINLLREIKQVSGGRLPVILMTGYLADCVRLTTTLQELGARQFLTKPLNSPEYSAAAMVLKALNNGGRNGGVAPQLETTRPSNPSGAHKPRQFSGGELRILADRAELSGTVIITDRNGGQSLRVLERLARRDKGGNYVHCSGEDLAESLEVLGGSGAVTSYIQTLRRNISKRLAERGIECGREDVIGHDPEGYFLREWIEVREGDGA